jgi:hypothetical protein
MGRDPDSGQQPTTLQKTQRAATRAVPFGPFRETPGVFERRFTVLCILLKS